MHYPGFMELAFGRKDMEVYGQTGYIITTNNTGMRLRAAADAAEHQLVVTSRIYLFMTTLFLLRRCNKKKI